MPSSGETTIVNYMLDCFHGQLMKIVGCIVQNIYLFGIEQVIGAFIPVGTFRIMMIKQSGGFHLVLPIFAGLDFILFIFFSLSADPATTMSAGTAAKTTSAHRPAN